MPDHPLLDISNVTKDYRRGVRANDDISFSVSAGEVCGLLGHNGAGKTTLLNQIVGLLKPTSGSIHLGGRDAVADPDMARQFCSFQPQSQAPLEGVTPRQAIELMARIRGADRRSARARADQLIAALDLAEWADKRGDKLSGGVKRLTAFCMAAALPGRLVMFDEPTNDVDPVRRRLLWQQIRELAEDGCGVVLVTHNVLEAERAVENLVILDKGRVVAQGSPAQLRGDRSDHLRLEIVALDGPGAERAAAQFAALSSPVITGRRAVIEIDGKNSPDVIAQARIAQESGAIEEFSIMPVSLEDVYIRLVEEDARSDEEAEHAALVS